MTSEENKKIAALTTGAIKTTTAGAVKAMMDAVEAAESKTAEMRAAVEEFIREFEAATNTLADNVSVHVASCQAAIDSFQEHHLKILNVEPQAAPPKPVVNVAAMPRVRPAAVDLDSIGRLQDIANGIEQQRR